MSNITHTTFSSLGTTHDLKNMSLLQHFNLFILFFFLIFLGIQNSLQQMCCCSAYYFLLQPEVSNGDLKLTGFLTFFSLNRCSFWKLPHF